MLDHLYKQEFDIAKNALEKAGELLLKHFGHIATYEIKADESLVSIADKESERLIMAEISRAFPDSQIIGEESGQNHASRDGRIWALDPLDGTTNFLYGIPHFCISLGLRVANEWVLGMIYAPAHKTFYYAVAGHGAFCNDEKIHVGSASHLGESVVGIGRAFSSIYSEEVFQFYRFLSGVRAVRSMGSAALDMASLAMGKMDLYLCKGLQVWDTAGAFVILREAGAVVSGFSGGKYDPFDKDILCANPAIHAAFLKKGFQGL